MGFYKIANYEHTMKRIKGKKTQILGCSEAISNLSLPISPEKCFLSSKYSFSSTSEFTECPGKGLQGKMEMSFSLLPRQVHIPREINDSAFVEYFTILKAYSLLLSHLALM